MNKLVLTSLASIIFLLLLPSYCLHIGKLDISYVKKPKTERIASSASQELLFFKDPKDSVLRRSLLDWDTISTTSEYYWNTVSLGQKGGRIRDILYIQNDSIQRIVIASASGGLWYGSLDETEGVIWHKANCAENLFSSLEYDSISGLMFAGSGEGYFQSRAFPGTGVWISSDFGSNWQQLEGTSDIQYTFSLKHKGTSLYISSLNHGLRYLDTKNGTTVQILGRDIIDEHASVNNIEFCNDSTMLVSTGIRNTGAVYRSSNHGSTFSKVDLKITEDIQRVELARSQSSPNIVYALAQSAITGGVVALSRTANGGISWTRKSLPKMGDGSDFTADQAWYNLAIAVHPKNPNWLVAGGIDLHVSTNGGLTWQQITTRAAEPNLLHMHADQHVVKFINDTDILVGNDGGVYCLKEVFNPQLRRVVNLNDGLEIAQIYSGVLDSARNQLVLGTQDNGTQIVDLGGLSQIAELTPGDGGYVHIDSDNTDIIITSYIKNNYFVSKDGGNNFFFREFNNDGLFTNPSVYESSRNILYSASSPGKILRWSTPSTLGKEASDVSLVGFENDQITALALSPYNKNRVYIGSQAGKIAALDYAFIGSNRTVRTLGSFTQGGVVRRIIESSTTPNVLTVIVSNSGVDNIYTTNDYGKNWEIQDGNLPNIPVSDIIESEDGRYFLATHRGLWVTNELKGKGTEWKAIVSPFQNNTITQLILAGSNLYALTYGNGIFKTDINQAFVIDGPSALTLHETAVEASNCQANFSNFTVDYRILGCTNIVEAKLKLLHGTSTNKDITLKENAVSVQNSVLTIDFQIFDDAIVEQNEVLDMIIECDCNGKKRDLVVPIDLVDNDRAIITVGGATVHQIGDIDQTTDQYPFRMYYEDEKTLYSISASELLQSGVKSGSINGLELYVVQKKSDIEMKDFQIGIAQSSAKPQNTFTNTEIVYNKSHTTKEGWNTFIFQEPFDWNGVDDLWIQFCYDNKSWSNSDLIACHPTPNHSVYYTYKDSNLGCALTDIGHQSNLRPTTRIIYGRSAEIASESTGQYHSRVPDKSDIVMRDASGFLVSKSASASNNSIDCLSVGVVSTEDIVLEIDIFEWTFNTKMYDFSSSQDMQITHSIYFNVSEFSYANKTKPFYIAIFEGSNMVDEREIEFSDFEVLNGDLYSYTFTSEEDIRFAIIQKTTIDYRDRVSNVEVAEFGISPNPFNSTIQIQCSLAAGIAISKLEMFDFKGSVIAQNSEIDGENITISGLESLLSGWYFLKIVLTDGSHQVFKVVKE